MDDTRCERMVVSGEEIYVEYAQCPESVGETTFGVVAFIVLIITSCGFICGIRTWGPMAEACGARCNKAGKVTNYIRDETPPSKMSNRKKALLFLVVLMLVIVAPLMQKEVS